MLYSSLLVAALAAVSVNAVPSLPSISARGDDSVNHVPVPQEELQIVAAERDECKNPNVLPYARDPSNMLDYGNMATGKDASMWCSPWITKQCTTYKGDNWDHHIVIKRLDTDYDITGFLYLPRPQSPKGLIPGGYESRNGNIGNYVISYGKNSDPNGAGWITISNGTWGDNGDEKVVMFNCPISKEYPYVRLTSLKGGDAGGRGFWACAWKLKLFKRDD